MALCLCSPSSFLASAAKIHPRSSSSTLPKALQQGARHATLSAIDDHGLPAALCNVADSFITQFLDPPVLNPSVDPKVQLSGNLSPVAERPPEICRNITGSVPTDLNGIYIRNGPNGKKVYGNGGHHMFDGDGMLHGVRIKDGIVSYCCRHVRTSRFVQEEEAGRPLFPRFFGGYNGFSGFARNALAFVRLGLGLLDLSRGWGLANTSVSYFNGKVLAMSEDDMPYIIRVADNGDMETVGKLELGRMKMNMCAHPKLDPVTGELFAFSLNPIFMPPFSFFRLSPDGVKSADIPIPLMDLCLVHDFAITKKYVVFPDNQFAVRPLAALNGEFPVVVDKSKVPRLGLLPRYATPEQAAMDTMWFEVPECNCFHYLNAWDEGEEVVVIAFFLSPPELFLEVPAERLKSTLTEIRLNTRTGASSQRKVSEGNFEFGAYNHKYTGRRTKYAYMSSGAFPWFSGVAKIDLESKCVVGRREYGESCYGSEPFFVASTSSSRGEEDDGYLLSFVHNQATNMSHLFIMDAKCPSLTTLACVDLPSRVPYGFHGYFVSEALICGQHSHIPKATR